MPSPLPHGRSVLGVRIYLRREFTVDEMTAAYQEAERRFRQAEHRFQQDLAGEIFVEP